MSAIPQSCQAILTALYRDTALSGDPHCCTRYGNKDEIWLVITGKYIDVCVFAEGSIAFYFFVVARPSYYLVPPIFFTLFFLLLPSLGVTQLRGH